VGPQILADELGLTVVTASRLLKALAQSDPIAVLQLIPGPNPLRRIIEGARRKGVGDEACSAAESAVGRFDELIRTEAGDRSALKAMLTAWLPEERKEFEAQRRQAIFKARAELDGVSCGFSLTSILLHPSAEDPSRLDIVLIECLLGIDRLRPEAVVKMGTRRMVTPSSGESSSGDPPTAAPRQPTNLEGEIAVDGMHSVRLDEYCAAAPAPLAAEVYGNFVQYSLGPTGFGPSSTVDLVLAEVNRSEIAHVVPGGKEQAPFFFTIPEFATHKKVFDLLVHRDVFPGCGPELLIYDTAGRGPAVAEDPARRLDLRRSTETVEHLGTGLQRARLVEFARYGELLAHACDRLEWTPEEFRGYRVRSTYPLIGAQLTLVFGRGTGADR